MYRSILRHIRPNEAYMSDYHQQLLIKYRILFLNCSESTFYHSPVLFSVFLSNRNPSCFSEISELPIECPYQVYFLKRNQSWASRAICGAIRGGLHVGSRASTTQLAPLWRGSLIYCSQLIIVRYKLPYIP